MSFFDNAEEVVFRNKIVKKITRVKDGAILYELDNEMVISLMLKDDIDDNFGITIFIINQEKDESCSLYTFSPNSLPSVSSINVNKNKVGNFISYPKPSSVKLIRCCLNQDPSSNEPNICSEIAFNSDGLVPITTFKCIGIEFVSDSQYYGDFSNSLVIWGDSEVAEAPSQLTHTFLENTEHTVKIANVPYLSSSIFRGCSTITSIKIPEEITKFGIGTFYGCTSLTDIDMPDTMTSFGAGCFEQCTSLTNMNIPNSVKTLGIGCFRNCTGLESITIPATVTSVGNNCFFGCNNLKEYHLNWTSSSSIPTYNESIMPNNTNTIFYIPQGTKNLYWNKNYPYTKLVERPKNYE